MNEEITYVMPGKLGGVFNFVRNLVAHRQSSHFEVATIRTENAADSDALCHDAVPSDRDVTFRYSLPPENLHVVLRRLARMLSARAGVVVANDWIELAATARYDTGRAVVAVTHGDYDYYYTLALRHQDTIDAHVTFSERMFQRLRELLPGRTDSIFLLPYGVDLPREARKPLPAGAPLRLLYVGRFTREKGVFDLPAIDERLRNRRVAVSWTMVGSGPDESAVKAAWPNPAVRWTGIQPLENVLELYRSHDVLVLASRHEGLPVSLLEAGAAGVVPVISNLPSGIPDVVTPGVTGYRPEPGDIDGFVSAIQQLAGSRAELEAMSAAIRQKVATRYDAAICTAEYEKLFAEWRVWKRPRPAHVPFAYGSRLDKPWIPNPVVKAIRSVLK
ncbi:MAG TPA: glycosyltransferase family 4 protein [Vicinamibacterales bacterium]|jgi:glycosyltransferase involved in cell wall biosynthesis|nr:glycosyltransferase family 4 protein [Vicinamibacterales bacterium]